MEEISNVLVEQNDFIIDEIGEDASREYEGLTELDNIEEMDLFNDTNRDEEMKREKSEAERINDSFYSYMGISSNQENLKSKAKKQMKEYQLSKARRQSAQMSRHSAIDDFLGIGTVSRKYFTPIPYLSKINLQKWMK